MNDIQDIAECIVTASYNNGQAVAESKALTIKPTTVSLRFMRYIPTKNNGQKHFLWPQRDQATTYTVSGAPNISDYTYRATTLREGYIYIHYENKPDLFKEFQVDITSDMTNILSDLKDDVRTSTENIYRKYYCISNKDIIWIAYSEFQWSADYVNKIRHDKKLREKRMQKFDATKWDSKNGAPDAYTVDNIDGYIPLGECDTPPEKMDQNGETVWKAGIIDSGIDSGKLQWWKSHYDQVEALENIPDTRDEVFFCLHDPLGCADELAIELDENWKKMEAVIITMQTGIDQNVALREIITGKRETEDIIDKNKLKTIDMMHKSALLLYQAAFCSQKNIDKYGENLDRERLEQILGKEDRARIRNKIMNAKDRLVSLLKSEYYSNSIDEYLNQVDDLKLVGKNRKMIHISNLQYRINAKDHMYILADENKKIQDRVDAGIDYIKNELDNKKGILFKKVDINIKPKGDNLNRVILTWNTIAGGLSDFVKKHPKYVQTKVELLNGVRIFRNGEMILDQCFELSTFEKVINNKKPFFEAGRQMMNMTEELIEDTRFLQAADRSFLTIEQVTISQKFNTAFQREGKLYSLAENLSGSLAWNRFVASIAIVNMASALYQFGKEAGKNVETIKNTLSALSALSGVAETHRTYSILSKRISGKISKEVADELMKGLPVKACAVGVWFSAGVDAMDSGINIYRGDLDAAAMQGVAAILGAVAGVGIWMGWNPLGWVALLAAGTGFALLAVFFEDESLEELCKCCQFRLNKSWLGLGNNVFEFKGTLEACVSYHYKNSGAMVKSGFSEWSNYSNLYIRIADLLFGGTVVIESKPNVVSSRTVGPTTIQEHFKKELYVNIHFSMAKMFIADIDLKIYLFPKGFVSGSPQILLTKDPDNGNVRIIPQNDAEAEFFVALFDIPEKHQHIPNQQQYRPHAEIMVLCRCDDNAHTYPIDDEGIKRYVAVREKLYKKETVVAQPETPYNRKLIEKQEYERKRKLVCVTVSGDNIKRDSKENLLIPDNWK